MRKASALGLLGALALMGMTAGNAGAYSATYDQKTTLGRDTFESKVSMKDQLFRLESNMGGQQSIIIRNAEGTFTYMPAEGIAMKTQLRPGQGPVAGADNYEQYLQSVEAEQTGSETIDGRACDVYRYSDPETGETTVWVWTEKMFPIRLRSAGMQTDISNIEVGAAIPDDAFQLPPGVQVMDMGNLMGMMQQR